MRASRRAAGGPATSGGRLLAVGAVLAWAGPLTLDAYSPGFVDMARDLQVPHSIVQLSVTSGLVGLALGQLLAGVLADIWGRRRLALCALLAFAAATFLAAVAWNVPVLMGARLVQGLCAAASVAVSRTIGRDLLTGRALGAYYSQLTALTAVAPVVGPIAAAGVLTATGSWRWIFAMITVAALVAWLVVWASLPETAPVWSGGGARPRTRLRDSLRRTLSLTRRPSAMAGALAIGCASGMVLSYLSGTSYLLQERFGLSPMAYSVLFALNALAIIVAGQLAALLLRRLSAPTILTLGFSLGVLLAIALIMALLFQAPLGVVAPMLAGVLLSYGMAMSMSLTIGMSSVPAADVAPMAGLLGLAQFGFGALTAPIVGLATDAVVPAMAIVLLGYAVAGLIVSILIRTRVLVRDDRLRPVDMSSKER